MNVEFSIQEGIQVIAISGTLTQLEAAAVRVTLEKKINVGRTKVVVDLKGLDITDQTTGMGLGEVLNYSFNRAVVTAVCGLPPSQWPLLVKEGQKVPKFFVTRDEAVYYLNLKPEAKPPVAEGQEGDPDENYKKEAMQELLNKYDVFQYRDDDDPLRLEFYMKRLSEDATSVGPEIETRARIAKETIEAEIKTLEEECVSLSTQVKSAMLSRKQPHNEVELRHKVGALTRDLESKNKENENSEKKVRENEAFMEGLKAQKAELDKKHDLELKELEAKIKTLTAEVEGLEKELKK